MSSSAIQATTSEVETEILVNMISEELSNLVNTEMPVSVHLSSDDSDLSGEEYWDDLDDYDARLPRHGHKLKHGKLIEKRGSNQEKFISPRPKALVKYGTQLFTGSADNIDEKAKDIIREFVEKHHHYSFNDINTIILSGERSVLVHIPGRLDERTGKREGEETLIKVYKHQYWVDRDQQRLIKLYYNLFAMRPYVNIPNMFYPTRNVGPMSFIGDDGIPAPNLNEVPFEITEKIYSDVVTAVHELYNKGKTVHGKLSAKTILWWRDKLWFVGLSHSVPTYDPKALQKLMKDCCHITQFFKSKGVLKVKSIGNLFKYITGLNYIDQNVHHVLRNTRKPVKNIQKRMENSRSRMNLEGP